MSDVTDHQDAEHPQPCPYCQLEKDLREGSATLNGIADDIDRAAVVGPPPDNAQLRRWVHQLSDFADALKARADFLGPQADEADPPPTKALQ